MARFVKAGLTGYKDVQGGYSDPECEYVILSKKEYMADVHRIDQAEREATSAKNELSSSNQEWKKKYDKLYSAYESWRKHAEDLEQKESIPEGMVAISEEELNGYKKAIRIVRDRALQQVEKSKADEHGYTLLRADRRQYERKSGKAWLVTKSTPYSIKIAPKDALYMIETDLREFYSLRNLPVVSHDFNYDKTLSVGDLLRYYDRYFNNEEDYSDIRNEEMLCALTWMAETNGTIVFEISRLARNAATGCYEVSYWATEPV